MKIDADNIGIAILVAVYFVTVMAVFVVSAAYGR